MRAARILCLLAFFSVEATATPTLLALHPEEGGAPYLAEYSQAVMVRALLVRGDGSPIAGERVTFKLRHDDDNGSEFVFDDPVTDALGVATARLTFVNGRHGGQSFVASERSDESDGERYVVGASFQGDPFAEDCALPDGGAPDAGAAALDGGEPEELCDADGEVELFLALEQASLVLEPGIEVVLGGTVQLVAILRDDNGDAEQAGTAVDGNGPRPLAERPVGFFYDVNGNGRAENNERVQCENTGETRASTNDDGEAACDFFADPAFVDTVNVQNGIHAQFGGDERYSVAGAAQAITVRAAPPDASRTLVEALPNVAPGDGFTEVELSATLVDSANNVLGVDDDEHDVVFTSDLGTVQGEAAVRDPLTGIYKQTLLAPQRGGNATVQVVVEGVPGTTVRVTFEQQGCTCRSTTSSPVFWLGGLCALAATLMRRRRA